MCLSIAVRHPDHVLLKGEHLGFEWVVTHNGSGYRCGYARVPSGHPWHGREEDIECSVHGGLTFSNADFDCGKGRNEDGWWIGFDCGHCYDQQDPTLPCDEKMRAFEMHNPKPPGCAIRTTDYVKAECISLCEQAKAAEDELVEAAR